MNNSYTLDIYRTDNAILIHDRPGGWKRAILGLLVSLFPVYFAIACAVGFYFGTPQQAAVQQQLVQQEWSLWQTVGLVFSFLLVAPVFVFMIFSFTVIFFFSLWRIGGHETILIDRDSIRHDWWCFWGHRSRILPRPEKIQTEAIPGFLITGGRFGVKMHIGKRQKWFGTRKIYMYLPSGAERKWLFNEIAKFQQEVPVTQPVDETRPVEKGSYTDHSYGENLLDTLEYSGKNFVRVVPCNESATTEETTEHLPAGVLQIRCVQCHRIVPHDHVTVERLIAKCPHCESVFSLNELERTGLPQRNRIRFRRDDDSLEVVQRPLRTGMPLCMVILFLLIDAGCIALYFYLQRLFPGEDPLMFLRAERDPNIAIGYRLAMMIAVMHLVFLFLPLWAMFDQRIIRIDRETLRITGSWLFVFRWRRTVPRILVKRANCHAWEILFYQAKLVYGKRSVTIGCSTEAEVGAVCAGINHFLYTVPPWPAEHTVFPPPEPAFVGGVNFGSPEIRLHCPGCGTQYPASSLDFPQQTAHCSGCQKMTSLEHVISYPTHVVENKPSDDLLVEKTDDQLSIRYNQNIEKGMKYVNLICLYFIMIFFCGTMLGVTYMLSTDEKIDLIGRCVMLLIFILPMSVMIVFIYFKLSQEKNAMYCDWAITVTPNEMTLEHRYKHRTKTIVLERDKIARVDLNLERNTLSEIFPLGTYPCNFLENREPRGAHILLTDGTKQYLPLLSLNTYKIRDTTRWLTATLNEFLALHPGKTGNV